jgi:two-component system OmpR family response regulator
VSSAVHIAVLDDDAEITRLLSGYLQGQGYRVTETHAGPTLLRLMTADPPDLVLLDLGLPGEDGFSIARQLREHWNCGLVIVTGRGDAVDKVVGLEVGADDYLAKPFSPRELVGRIKAILRRTAHMPREPAQAANAYRFGEWRLDVTTRMLTHDNGTEHSLSGAEFRLLSILLAHPTRVLSRAQLMELLRGRDLDPFDRSVDVRVSRLRQVLGDDARSPRIIKTIYGEGYVMGVPVEQE